ncbi:hypothetical protein C4565_00390 [Candidatus Parcubacteria bacterium]|nr:MAG: hypothetical protein C4565_00390 [Candidatus Parcubacteria bacterium]
MNPFYPKFEEQMNDLFKEKSFDEMTREERKIAIAKDVIARMDMEKLNLKRGTYFDGIVKEKIGYSDSLQLVVDKLEQGCTVCAIGAVFLSHVRLFNQVSGEVVSRYGSEAVQIFSHDLIASVKDCFTHNEMLRLERIFEEGDISYTPQTRIRRAMEYIIQNNGEVPYDDDIVYQPKDKKEGY